MTDNSKIITTAAAMATVMDATLKALYFHISALIAMVTIRLFAGNDSVRRTVMSKKSKKRNQIGFRKLVAVLLTTILSVLTGKQNHSISIFKKGLASL